MVAAKLVDISTIGQIARGVNILGDRITKMAEQVDRLNIAVDQELADDAARNELIAELRTQLAAAADAATAKARESAARRVTDALAAADAAAVKLESNDPVVAEPPGDEPVEPPVDGGQV